MYTYIYLIILGISKNEKTRCEKQQIHEDRWILAGKPVLGRSSDTPSISLCNRHPNGSLNAFNSWSPTDLTLTGDNAQEEVSAAERQTQQQQHWPSGPPDSNKTASRDLCWCYPQRESNTTILVLIFLLPDSYKYEYMEVSWNRGTPKSSILMGLSLINHLFWGTPIDGKPQTPCFCWSSSADSPMSSIFTSRRVQIRPNDSCHSVSITGGWPSSSASISERWGRRVVECVSALEWTVKHWQIHHAYVGICCHHASFVSVSSKKIAHDSTSWNIHTTWTCFLGTLQLIVHHSWPRMFSLHRYWPEAGWWLFGPAPGKRIVDRGHGGPLGLQLWTMMATLRHWWLIHSKHRR